VPQEYAWLLLLLLLLLLLQAAAAYDCSQRSQSCGQMLQLARRHKVHGQASQLQAGRAA
jgi:hypothetical protein